MTEIDINDGSLSCPSCGETGDLHQRAARVVFRDKEDDDGTITTVDSAGVQVARIAADHIPDRRDVIEIDFECYHCENATHTLRIHQHKGQTMVGWSSPLTALKPGA